MQNQVLVVDQTSISASFGRVSLFVNEQFVLDLDYEDDGSTPVEEIAEKLASALGCQVVTSELSTEQLARSIAEHRGELESFEEIAKKTDDFDDWVRKYTNDDLLRAVHSTKATTYRVFNIKWDQDEDDDNALPSEVQVTVNNVELIGDRVSDIVGYCHFGFDYEKLSDTPRSALIPDS